MNVISKKQSITPTQQFLPCHLSGHAIREEQCYEILDPIFSTALLIQKDENQLLFITIELIGLEKKFTDKLRQQIAIHYSIPFNHIQIFFSHTHAAPEYQEKSIFGFGAANKGYMNFVWEQTLLSVKQCFECISTSKITKTSYKTVKIDGVYANRNGLELSSDQDVTLISFDNETETIGIICSFACHSTVLGPQNTKISGDLAGNLASKIEKHYGIYPLLIIGAAGDMSNRLFRKGNDEHELRRVCTAIFSQLEKKGEFEPINIDKIRLKPWIFQKTFSLNLAEKTQKIKKVETILQNAVTFDEKKVYTSALAILKTSLNTETFTLRIEAMLLLLGDLKVFTFPGELFAQFGIKLKKHLNAKCTLIGGYCNYNLGYFGDQASYGNTFETVITNIPKGMPEQIINEICQFIDKENTIYETLIG